MSIPIRRIERPLGLTLVLADALPGDTARLEVSAGETERSLMLIYEANAHHSSIGFAGSHEELTGVVGALAYALGLCVELYEEDVPR